MNNNLLQQMEEDASTISENSLGKIGAVATDIADTQEEISQLKEYFHEGRKNFDLDFRLEASPFALKVYSSMQEISYGKTVSYSDLAKAAGSKKAFRAVGTICGNNLLPIVIPCHRVLAKNGLGGFSSGIKLKKFLIVEN